MKFYARSLDNISTLRKVVADTLDDALVIAEKIFEGKKFEFVNLPKYVKVSKKETMEVFKQLTGMDCPSTGILL